MAQPVTYPKTKPEVYTADGWAELLTMRNEVAIRKILQVSTYAKAPDWSYENEWRILAFKRATDSGHFTDHRFDPQELEGVYLGPLICDADRSGLLSLAAGYSDVTHFVVSLGMSRELLFNEISG